MSVTTPENKLTVEQRLKQAVDHTKLTFAAGENETQSIEKLCQEARKHGFYAVCVRPRHIALSKELLNGSPVKVATVIGFPADKVKLDTELKNPTVGAFSTDAKVAETRQAVNDNVDELDLVIDVAQLKKDVQTGSRLVLAELKAIYEAAGNDGKIPVKVIIESDLLTPDEIEQVTRWCHEANMGMVKTSTGMVDGGQGATVEAVSLIRKTLDELNSRTGIKASGGVKTREQALAFLNLGVNRIGTSSGIAIVQNEQAADKSPY